MKSHIPATISCVFLALAATPGLGADLRMSCSEAGPQSPRDITDARGSNAADFAWAPAPANMNLCNVHIHTNAEHKGPGFLDFVDSSAKGGYACNDSRSQMLGDMSQGVVNAGETIEVHWVFTSCPVTVAPGQGLDLCLCDDPNLAVRVETQVFLAVTADQDKDALDFGDFALRDRDAAQPQPKALPDGTGTPVAYRGSTTGPAYDNVVCSAAPVTWSVRPHCAAVNVESMNTWFDDNAWGESESDGVRQLVTRPALLSPIE